MPSEVFFVFRKFRALSLSNGLIWELNIGISCNLIMCAQELMESLVLRSTFIFTVAFSAVFSSFVFPLTLHTASEVNDMINANDSYIRDLKIGLRVRVRFSNQ